MMRAACRFVRHEVGPRWKKIVLNGANVAAAGSGIAIALLARPLGLESVSLHAVHGSALTYAAISLGFCLAGLTLVLGLVDGDYERWLTKKELAAGSKQSVGTDNRVGNLLFVFAWASVMQWVLVVASTTTLILAPESAQLLDPNRSSAWPAVLLGVYAWLLVYSFLLMLIVILTLAKVGRVKILKSIEAYNTAQESAGEG